VAKTLFRVSIVRVVVVTGSEQPSREALAVVVVNQSGGFGIRTTGNRLDSVLRYFPESSRRNLIAESLTQSTNAREPLAVESLQRNRAPRSSSEKIMFAVPRNQTAKRWESAANNERNRKRL
jgi:hypothetical protein